MPDLCGVPFPSGGQVIAYRCELADGHDGDHRSWGVLETPGEATSWVMTWETEVLGN